MLGVCEGFNNFNLPPTRISLGRSWDAVKERLGQHALAALQTFLEEVRSHRVCVISLAWYR